MSIKRAPSHCRFILNISLRDHDEKVEGNGNGEKIVTDGERERKTRMEIKTGEEARKARKRAARALPSPGP